LHQLVLYGRAGCHLCEEMLAGLEALEPELGFSLSVIDVDASPQLAERYGSLVPVLMLGDQEVCRYFLDPAAMRQQFER
jgi:glutaredoxin